MGDTRTWGQGTPQSQLKGRGFTDTGTGDPTAMEGGDTWDPSDSPSQKGQGQAPQAPPSPWGWESQ